MVATFPAGVFNPVGMASIFARGLSLWPHTWILRVADFAVLWWRLALFKHIDFSDSQDLLARFRGLRSSSVAFYLFSKDEGSSILLIRVHPTSHVSQHWRPRFRPNFCWLQSGTQLAILPFQVGPNRFRPKHATHATTTTPLLTQSRRYAFVHVQLSTR